MRRSALFLPMLAVGAMLGVAPAFGQVGLNSRKNSDQPIDITSDTLEVQQDKQLAIFRGNVDAIQGDTRLRSAELYVYYRERSNNQQAGTAKPPPSGGPDASSITKIEAKGDVFVSTPQERGQGDFGIYDVDKKTITLTGNVVLSNDQGTVRCARAVMYQDTGRSTCDPIAGGRVRGVFVPKGDEAPANGAATKPGAKP
ncbi:MAG: LptA/OstA family protein [Ferrovibrio sp.]|uniref:LptA/OstA family protein n=1 Tax=Ferrovibrio sp. TaxID=1917215 RepID=UPI00391CC6F0